MIWGQVIRRDSGEAQLEIVGKGDKVRQVLIPAEIAARLLASRGDGPASAPVFGSVRRPGEALTERAVNYLVKTAAERAGVNPAVSVHWLRARPRQPCDRQRGADHACVGHPRPCRSEDDIGLCARSSRRELGALPKDVDKNGALTIGGLGSDRRSSSAIVSQRSGCTLLRGFIGAGCGIGCSAR